MGPILRHLVLALLLPVVAHASLTVGPAVPLSDEAERVGAFRPQNFPSVAWSGDIGLVVWMGKSAQTDFLLATHVDATGQPLESAPIIVKRDTPLLSVYTAALGSRFLVLWLEPYGEGTHGAFVERDGTVRPLDLVIPSPFFPNDLTSDDSTALLAGNSGDGHYPVVLHWIDASGRLQNTKTYGADAYRIQAEHAGDSFVVAWWEMHCGEFKCDHAFYKVDALANGTASEPQSLLTAKDADVFAFTLAGFGLSRDRLLLLFTEAGGVTTGKLFSRQGEPLTATFPVEDRGAGAAPIAVVADGDTFLLAYAHIVFDDANPPVRTTRLRRISIAGASAPVVLDGDTNFVALRSTGSGLLMVRAGGLIGPSENVSVRARRLGAASDYVISRAPNQQDGPAGAWDGTSLMPAWEEFFPAEGLWKVRYGRGDLATVSSFSQRHPRIVFDGNNFLLLWVENGEIRARRIRRDGSASDTPFTVGQAACGTRFDAARSGSSVLVVHIGGTTCEFAKRRQVLLTTVVNDAVAAQTVLAEQAVETPVIAVAGNSALVVWTQHLNRLATDSCPNIYEFCPQKQVLSGAIVEGNAVRPVLIAGGAQMLNREPQISWNGRNYLLAWLAAGDFNQVHFVQSRLFTRDAEPLSDARVLGRANYGYELERNGSVASSPGGFTVAWIESDIHSSLSVWRIAANGTPIDATARKIENDARDVRSPQLIDTGSGNTLLLYSVNGPDEIYFGHNRVVSRSLGETTRTRAARSTP